MAKLPVDALVMCISVLILRRQNPNPQLSENWQDEAEV
jgi:hypothetical protein